MEEKKNWYNDVPAPMDADGKIVPLGVKELYASNGEALDVELIGFNGRWVVKSDREGLFNLDWFHLSEPDSWERLEQDAAKTPCDYYLGADCPNDSNGCHMDDPHICYEAMARDLIRRAKALAESDAND